MRFSIISAALFATALALPASYESSNELVARDFNLIHKLPKFSFGKKGGASAASSDSGDGGDGGDAGGESGESGGSGGSSGVYDIKGAIQTIDQDTVALTEQVDKFDGGDSDAALALMKVSDTLIDHIRTGLKGTQGSAKIPFSEGLQILPVFTSFVPNTKKAMTSLTGKKDQFVKAGVVSVVLQKLTSIQALGQQFDEAVVAKLDAISKPFGKAVYKPVNQSLLDAVKLFQGLPADAAPSGSGATDAAAIAAADGE